MTKVTVLIPVYNGAKTIRRCLESILAQTYKDFEVLIYDDGSTDDTYHIINRWERKNGIKISISTAGKNDGLGVARESLLKSCKTEYGVWCDADDEMNVDKLRQQVEYLDNNLAANFVATEMYDMTPAYMPLNNNVKGYISKLGSNTAKKHLETTFESLLEKCEINGCTVMFRTKVAQKFTYQTEKKFGQMCDWDMWKKIYAAGEKMHCIAQPLYNYYIRPKIEIKPTDKKIFRFDDICINSNLAQANAISAYLKNKFPYSEIWYCISPLVHDMSGEESDIEKQRCFPKIYNALSDIRNFFCVQKAGIPECPEYVKKVSHGLFHVDHRHLSKSQQEMSIMASAMLTPSNYFVPPFNKFNQDTVDVCKNLGVKLVKFEDEWRSMEWEKWDEAHNYWYLHHREWDLSKLKLWLNEH